MLDVKYAVCGYANRAGRKEVLKDVSFKMRAGEILCILGANGIGKTTLFKTIMGNLPLLGGDIQLCGQSIKKYSRREAARLIAYVPQEHIPPFPFTVLDIVSMGRASAMHPLASPSMRDEELAMEALESLEIGHLADRIYTEISGGERQLALIARALTQQSRILVMDEPSASLDYGNQIRLLRQMDKLSQKGIGILFTTHYPNHAFLCAKRVAVIKNDGSFTIGKTDEILSEQLLQDIYGIHTQIVDLQAPDTTHVKACFPFL